VQTNLWRYLEYREPRRRPPATRKGDTEALHQGDSWVYWADGSVTSRVDPPSSASLLTKDAAALIDLVWGSDSFAVYQDWSRLASIEHITEREILGIARPLFWQGKLERLTVEYRNGDQGSLFLHSYQKGGLSFVDPSLTFEEEIARTLERPEPMLLYEVFLDSCVPRLDFPKDAPTAIVIRPQSHCCTVYQGQLKIDVPTLQDAMLQFHLLPAWVWLVSAFIEGATPLQLAQSEIERLRITGLSCKSTGEGVWVERGGTSIGPCRSHEEVLRAIHQLTRGGPWHVSERRQRAL
jgi:hypothetical protein